MSEEKERDPFIIEVGRRIQKYRLQNNLTQEELAEKIGISQKHLSRIEQGYHNPRFDMITRISSALSVPTDALAKELGDDDISVFLEGIKPDIEKMGYSKREYVKKSIELLTKVSD